MKRAAKARVHAIVVHNRWDSSRPKLRVNPHGRTKHGSSSCLQAARHAAHRVPPRGAGARGQTQRQAAGHASLAFRPIPSPSPVRVSIACTTLAWLSTALCSRAMHTYSLPAPCCAFTSLVARSMHTMRLPDTCAREREREREHGWGGGSRGGPREETRGSHGVVRKQER